MGNLLMFLLVTNVAYAQDSLPEKASPFTAVNWQKDEPLVQFQGDWYQFEQLDHLSKEDILNFVKKAYPSKWKKRFSEDLVEVLAKMGYTPKLKVELSLNKAGIVNIYQGKMSQTNRVLVVENNRKKYKLKPIITNQEALEDIEHFRDLLTQKSSYIQLSDFDYKASLSILKKEIKAQNVPIKTVKLANQLKEVMSKVGDRHFNVNGGALDKLMCPSCDLRVPFYMAVLGERIIALTKKNEQYEYLDPDYPEIKSIQGMKVKDFINTYAFKHLKAPEPARWARGVHDIRKLTTLMFLKDGAMPTSIKVVFTNGKNDRVKNLLLSSKNHTYYSKIKQDTVLLIKQIIANDFSNSASILDHDIGYIKIPRMFNHKETPGYASYIKGVLDSFLNTKALIIDIRNNSGGQREILELISNYIVSPSQSPWVANITYMRTDYTDFDSMKARLLHPYDSDAFDTKDRSAINSFMKTFSPVRQINPTSFSQPFYMVLRHGDRYYQKPVYILVNEQVFSAASVFTSAFKGLNNVQIVGVRTDGSSGRSKDYYLKNSHIKVTLSTMVSYQRNGQTLDGNGTKPDIVIEADKAQVLQGHDTQLTRLLALINDKPVAKSFRQDLTKSQLNGISNIKLGFLE